jgi:hypothetical protein
MLFNKIYTNAKKIFFKIFLILYLEIDNIRHIFVFYFGKLFSTSHIKKRLLFLVIAAVYNYILHLMNISRIIRYCDKIL